jgi:tetratricopeptide (TPR) repeat protein
MPFTSPLPYVKQISLYLKSDDYAQAYPLSKEFAKQFPEEMFSHLFLAKCLMGLEKIQEAEKEAFQAFNLSKGPQQIVFSGILLSCIYFHMEKYSKGKRILDSLRKDFPERMEIEKLQFIFAMSLQDAESAADHLIEIYQIDWKTAQELAEQFLKE